MKNKGLGLTLIIVFILLVCSCKGYVGRKYNGGFEVFVNEFIKVNKAEGTQPSSYMDVIKCLPSGFEEVVSLRKKMISREYPDVLLIPEIRDSIISFVETGKMKPPVNISSWHLFYSIMTVRKMRSIRRKNRITSPIMDIGYKMAYKDYVTTIDVSYNADTVIAGIKNRISLIDKRILDEFPESFSDFCALLEDSNDCICNYLYESPNIEKSQLMTKFARIAYGGTWYADGVSSLYEALLDYMVNHNGIGVVVSELNRHSKDDNDVFWSMVFGGPAPENKASDMETIKKLLTLGRVDYRFMKSVDEGYLKAIKNVSYNESRPQIENADYSKCRMIGEMWDSLQNCGDSLFRYSPFATGKATWINDYLARIDYPLINK